MLLDFATDPTAIGAVAKRITPIVKQHLNVYATLDSAGDL